VLRGGVVIVGFLDLMRVAAFGLVPGIRGQWRKRSRRTFRWGIRDLKRRTLSKTRY
jgi:hypothetical protein